MLDEKVTKALAGARDVLEAIHTSCRGKSAIPAAKNVMTIAASSLAMAHLKSIVILLEKEQVGSALALVRSVRDTYIKAHWLWLVASEEQAQELTKVESRFWKNGRLLRELEESFAREDLHANFGDATDLRDYMDGLVHSGIEQLAFQLDDNMRLQPSYPTGNILLMIERATRYVLLTSFIMRHAFGDDVAAPSAATEAYNLTFGQPPSE